MKSLNADNLWNNLCSYPKVGERQKEQMEVFHALHFSPSTTFGSIKDLLHNVSEETMEQCMEHLYMMPTMDGGEEDEPIDENGRYHLHGNMFHEIVRMQIFYTHTWDATPKKKKKKRAFF